MPIRGAGTVRVLGPASAMGDSDAGSWSLELCARAAAGSGHASGTRTRDRVPPFAVLGVDTRRDTLEARVDDIGLRHVYWTRGTGWAALSTSSTTLAVMSGCRLDELAIGGFALTGSYLGNKTPYRNVEKIAGGSSVTMRFGQVEVAAARPHIVPTDEPWEQVPAGVSAIREAVGACLLEAPDAAIELSGGLDSRVVLAAIPPDQREGMTALTLGYPDSHNVRIAKLIADACRMRHVVVDLSPLDELTPHESAHLIRRSSIAHDHSSNPLSSAVFDWVEERFGQGPRFTGQNGEFARGFFYPGQREHPRPTDELVTRLAEWRLFTNDRVAPDLFRQGYLEETRAASLEQIQETFASFDTTWLRATDEYYLDQRMHRWVGISMSASCMSRVVLAPFFHPRFLEWARAVSPADKRDSRLFARVLSGLDERLASVPLVSGTTPHAIGYPSFSDRLHHVRHLGAKAVRKVQQRLSSGTRASTGTEGLALLQRRAWAEDDSALARLTTVPFLDADVIAKVASGDRSVDAATVAFLVTMDGMLAAEESAAEVDPLPVPVPGRSGLA